MGEQFLSLPHYESLSNKQDRIHEKFLSPADLVDQVHNLMLDFKQMRSDGNVPDAIFLLDRGAAPFEQIIQRLFPYYCSETIIPPIFHINIGRPTPAKGNRGINVPFTGSPEIIKASYQDMPSDINDVLILDDYSKSGETIRCASAIFRRAFPNSRITSKVAFTKIPSWQGDSDYTGLEEYTTQDYADSALKQLNQELAFQGLCFSSLIDILAILNNNNRWIWSRFLNIQSVLMGTIPHARIATSPSFTREEIETELNILCEAVVERKLVKH